jgi:tRNA-2-methylthio-N6-dimethylallyladenosine synthase
LDVLFERAGRHPGRLAGRSPYLQLVQVTAPAALLGGIAAVTITDTSHNSLFGVLAHAPAQQPVLLGAGA